MHTINAVENRRISKRSSANLLRFHKLLLVTDTLRGKAPRERRMGHLPYLTTREKEEIANKGNCILLVPKQRAIFFQLVYVIFLQQNSLLRIQNLIGDCGSR